MLARFSEMKTPDGQNDILVKDHHGMVIGKVVRRICQAPVGTQQRMRDMAFIRYNHGAYFLYTDIHGLLFIKTDCKSLMVKYSHLK